MALTGKATFVEVETRPVSLPIGQITFVKDEKAIVVNHGDKIVVYGGES